MDDATKERFFAKVDKTDDCWLWTGVKFRNQYGRFEDKVSHRVSWLIAGNTIPEDKPILRHKCRNRHCVNPEHLEVGTHRENTADRIRDGTDIRGENVKTAKLTPEQVIAIRGRTSEIKTKLAEEFGVSKAAIYDIIHRRNWKHL